VYSEVKCFADNSNINVIVTLQCLDTIVEIRINSRWYTFDDRLCGLVVRVLGYRSGGPGSIHGTTRKKKCSGSGTGCTQPREYN
jgi:hypothetical protein